MKFKVATIFTAQQRCFFFVYTPKSSQWQSWVVGDSLATGTRGIAVDPFPQSNSRPSILIDLPSTSQAATETLEIEQEIHIHNPQPPVEAGLQIEHSEQQGEKSFVGII
nr:uncharacterized protein LOC128674725 [Plodia interpunctella]XP_053619897.1 uncharacterized protein LOC128680639 [Plodia interpunctella]